MKDVLKCFVTASGEQCAVTDSLMQQQELFAALSDLSTYRLATFVFAKAVVDSCVFAFL